MARRLIFFGFGAIISIFFLSMGPENRLKQTFYAYIDYFDMDKRVITHLKNKNTSFSTKAECQLVYYNLTKDSLLSVLDEGKVNFPLSEEDREPCQYYFVERKIYDSFISVKFELCYYNDKSVKVISFKLDNKDGICNF
tara:strand:- start:733 stop:1149 length:417 start_codon:yes stop_codon:yes gene_type:complete